MSLEAGQDHKCLFWTTYWIICCSPLYSTLHVCNVIIYEASVRNLTTQSILLFPSHVSVKEEVLHYFRAGESRTRRLKADKGWLFAELCVAVCAVIDSRDLCHWQISRTDSVEESTVDVAHAATEDSGTDAVWKHVPAMLSFKRCVQASLWKLQGQLVCVWGGEYWIRCHGSEVSFVIHRQHWAQLDVWFSSCLFVFFSEVEACLWVSFAFWVVHCGALSFSSLTFLCCFVFLSLFLPLFCLMEYAVWCSWSWTLCSLEVRG